MFENFWGLWIVVLEKTPESPLESKKTKLVSLKGNQPWVFIGTTDAEAEASVFQSTDVNSQLIGKVPDAGKDWGQKEKRTSEDEMAELYHWCSNYELGQISGDGGDGKAWHPADHGVAKSQTWLGDWIVTIG